MTCQHPTCIRPAFLRDLCRVHYRSTAKSVPAPKVRRSICSVQDCSRRVHCKDLCQSHYARHLRQAKAERIMAAQCVVEGCGRGRDALDMCQAHYARFQDHGDVFAHIPIGSGRRLARPL